MVTKTVDLHETQASLQELLALVRAGMEIVLTEGNMPLARITPVEESVEYPLQWRYGPEDAEQRIAALHAAIDGFWDGFTPEEIDEIVEAMNSEYIEPEDPALFAWIDELPEDER